MIVELDNKTFAEEFARRLNILVRDAPKDMLYLGSQSLPTGTERGSMVLWRIFSLLCLEGPDGYLIIPHQSHTVIGAIHAIPASKHDVYRTKREPLPEPDRLPPQLKNGVFARELARRMNRLFVDYPEWVAHWITFDLLVRHELCQQITMFDDEGSSEVKAIGLPVILSLACSADHEDAPFGIDAVEEITSEKIVHAVEGKVSSETTVH